MSIAYSSSFREEETVLGNFLKSIRFAPTKDEKGHVIPYFQSILNVYDEVKKNPEQLEKLHQELNFWKPFEQVQSTNHLLRVQMTYFMTILNQHHVKIILPKKQQKQQKQQGQEVAQVVVSTPEQNPHISIPPPYFQKNFGKKIIWQELYKNEDWEQKFHGILKGVVRRYLKEINKDKPFQITTKLLLNVPPHNENVYFVGFEFECDLSEVELWTNFLEWNENFKKNPKDCELTRILDETIDGFEHQQNPLYF
jgi:hypothetical protein